MSVVIGGVPMRGRSSRVWLALAGSLLTSCASFGARLARLNDEGQHREAATRADVWLNEHRSEEGTRDWEAVHREFGRASFAIARAEDTPGAYTRFLDRFGYWRSLADLVRQARELQASAELRMEVAPTRSIERLRAFRRRAAGTAAASRAWLLEAEIALGPTLAAETVEACQTFRQAYAEVPGAAEVLARALRREAELALDAVIAAPSIEGFQTFVTHYEAAALDDLRSRARTAEAGFALDGAVSEATVEALERFAAAYPQAPWPARADAAIAALLLGPLRGELAGDGHVTHATADRLVAAWGAHRALLLRERPPEGQAFAAAQSRGHAAFWRCVVALYPDSPAIEQARAGLRDALRREAAAAPSSEAWLRFVQYFPEDAGAGEAERFLRVEGEAERAARRGYTVAVGRSRVDDGEVELTLTVRDCAGEPVIGLPAAAFRVYVAGAPRPVTAFLGMEDPRPLTVEMALDLSGSMAVEQNAVRESMVRFVDTLRYRGRDVRVGLVGFSDLVMVDERPSDDPREFMRWMSRLPQTAGGSTGEDGVGALARSLDVLERERAERVVVMLSDEPLQTNAEGRNALRAGRGCAQVMGAANCVVAAAGRPRRQLACVRRLGGMGPAARRCEHRYPAQQCVAWLGPELHGTAARCADASGLVAPLSTLLDERAVRPFFVVSDPHDSRDAFGAYRELATSLGGSLLEVPDDAVDTAPYSEALRRVAEVLSSQYVLRYRGSTGAGPLRVLVRPQHDWMRSSLVSPDATTVRSLGGGPECPNLLAVRRDGRVLRSTQCGSGWSDTGARASSDAVATAADGRVAVSLRDGGLAVYAADGVVTIAPGANARSYLRVAFDAVGRLWSLGGGPAGDRVLAFDRAGHPSVDWPLPAPAGLFTMVPTQRDDTVCVLSADGARRCRREGDSGWDTRGSTGLSPAAVTAVLAADSGFPLLLAATIDGAVYRSVDRGLTFAPVLMASGAAPTTTSFARSPGGDVVCAGQGARVWCSEDEGLSWIEVGASATTGDGGVFFVGASLHAVRGGRIEAAGRVLTRELPGAAALFDTGSDRPRTGATALLEATARTIASDARLLLRVEGHADPRGSSADNDALAARRAEQVAQILADFGVPRGRMQVSSHGERRPIRAGTSAADLARNRRVELIVLAPMPSGGWYANRCER